MTIVHPAVVIAVFAMAPAVACAQPSASSTSAPQAMSKNRRDKIEKDIASAEGTIATLEAELATLEGDFANPAPEFDWKAGHRRHAEIQATLDRLYDELAELSGLLESK